MEDQCGADIHTAGHEELQAEAGRHTLMEAAAQEEPSEEQGPGRAVTCGRAAYTGPDALQLWPMGHQCWRRTVPCGKDHAEAVPEGLYLPWEVLGKTVFCGRDSVLEQEKGVRRKEWLG